MINQKRRQALLYLSLAIIGMILLGVSLPYLQFQAGLPIPGAEPESIDAPENEQEYPEAVSPSLFPYWLALGIILTFFALITALLKKVSIKRLLLLATALGLLFVFFSLLANPAPSHTTSLPDDNGVVTQLPFDYIFAPIGEPPASLFSCVIAAFLLASVVLITWLVSHAFHREKEEDKLAMEAQLAVQAIADGQNLRNVIIQYYAKMESIIAQERGIERAQAVTPREFETYLVEKGIPRIPILQLTFLFEKARYGNESLNEQEEQDAINCFCAIQKACQSDLRGTP